MQFSALELQFAMGLPNAGIFDRRENASSFNPIDGLQESIAERFFSVSTSAPLTEQVLKLNIGFADMKPTEATADDGTEFALCVSLHTKDDSASLSDPFRERVTLPQSGDLTTRA